MKDPDTLFDPVRRAAWAKRIRAVRADSPRAFGRMDAARMLAHCRVGLEVALAERPAKRALLGVLFGWYAKRVALGTKPLPRNLPTGPEFIVSDPRPLEEERAALLAALERFGARPAQLGSRPHPFFGPMDADEQDRLQRRHLDHHLGQFGA
jgi:hypothetical protein